MAKRKDFDIEIREELSRTVTVKAETLGDAINRVMDQYKRGSRVVSCPTEDEAREYIREQEGSESDGN